MNTNTYRQNIPTVFIMAVLFITALTLRTYFFCRSFDFPGDAPSYALTCYRWMLHPHWISVDVSMPGFYYLGGLANFLLPDPANALRLTNITLGSITTLVIFALTKELYDKKTALLAAVGFAFLPLHIGLSASSMSEVSGNLFLTSSVYLFILASKNENKQRKNLLFAASLVYALALFFRTDAWTLMPVVLISLTTLSQVRAYGYLFFIVILSFPIYWLTSSYINSGQFFLSFGFASDPRYERIDLFNAIGFILIKIIMHIGPIALLMAMSEYWHILKRNIIPDIKIKSVKLLSPITIYWLFFSNILIAAIAISINCGFQLQDRYLLSLLAFSSPLAAAGLIKCLNAIIRKGETSTKKDIVVTVLSTLILINSMLIPFQIFKPQISITTEPYKSLDAIVAWLKKSKFSKSPTIVTSLNYRCMFIPLQCLENEKNFFMILDWWTPLLALQEKLKDKEPEIIITADNDGADLQALRSIFEFKLESKQPLFSSEDLSIYKIQKGSCRIIAAPSLTPCYWYPKASWRTLFKEARVNNSALELR